MSINFTSDIDGATSGSGITKIEVGGKTINLTEVGSGGSSMVTGSFTPEDKTSTYTIDTGIDFSFFAMYKKTSTLSYGYRTYSACFYDYVNNCGYSIASNAAGTTFGGGFAEPGTEKDGTKYIFKGNDYQYLCPEEYVWFAW